MLRLLVIRILCLCEFLIIDQIFRVRATISFIMWVERGISTLYQFETQGEVKWKACRNRAKVVLENEFSVKCFILRQSSTFFEDICCKYLWQRYLEQIENLGRLVLKNKRMNPNLKSAIGLSIMFSYCPLKLSNKT